MGGARIVFRCAESGPNTNRTPEIRLKNLIRELAEASDLERALKVAEFDTFRPADLGMVVRWMCSHPEDLYDLVEKLLVSESYA